MPGIRARGLLAASAALAVLTAGCGGDGGGEEIPRPAANEMLRLVDEIEQATAGEDCDTAESSTTALRNQVDALDDSETKTALNEMITQLDENLSEECADTGTTDDELETTTEPLEPTTTEPVEPTTTTQTTTTTTEEEPETPDQPPGEGGGSNGPRPPGGGGGGPSAGGVEAEE